MIKFGGNFSIKPFYPTSVTPVYERDMSQDPAVGRTLRNGVIIMEEDLSPSMKTETHSQRIELMEALKDEERHLLTVGGFYLSRIAPKMLSFSFDHYSCSPFIVYLSDSNVLTTFLKRHCKL